ncbi:hypothetical protein [Bradyrhizobium sp. 172]|uniref:hypothetical protein n=2 Tax=unclassified Bradyrhizobium TaxID=2631580 RepID=UPI001FFED087|nr:hypothetical protein [Bradyrhizobium sp. 172]UPJ99961.1 hypothetical protein IVB07_32840 [Bradyrhizobium sp. 172]
MTEDKFACSSGSYLKEKNPLEWLSMTIDMVMGSSCVFAKNKTLQVDVQSEIGEHVAKSTKRKEYSKDDVKLLKAHSKARTPVARVSKLMKRSEGSLRQKARTLGIGLGHQR